MEVRDQEKIIVYHNPKCSKSRCALEMLNEKKIEYAIVEYIKQAPTITELKEVIKKLGIRPVDVVRKGEKEYLDNFQNKSLTDAQWIQAMVKFPKLIERPIVIKGEKAVIARPAEKILTIL